MKLPLITASLMAIALQFTPMLAAAQDKAAVDAMESYLDFVEYGGATIFPEQIPRDDWKKFFVIDARDKDQFNKEHIPGAVNIPIDELRTRLDELPKDGDFAVYCQVGQRGYLATRILLQHGYKVRNIGGGYRTYLLWQGAH